MLDRLYFVRVVMVLDMLDMYLVVDNFMLEEHFVGYVVFGS